MDKSNTVIKSTDFSRPNVEHEIRSSTSLDVGLVTRERYRHIFPGARIGFSEVLGHQWRHDDHWWCICKCKCGNVRAVRLQHLLSKKWFNSCGCAQKKHHQAIQARKRARFGQILFDPTDEDLAATAKLLYNGKAFKGTHDQRRNLAVLIAERMLDRALRADERVVLRNYNRCDLRRANVLVVSTAARARHNRPKIHSSRFKGVSWQKSRGKWLAMIRVDGVSRNLGRYYDEVEAATAYNAAVKELGIACAFVNNI